MDGSAYSCGKSCSDGDDWSATGEEGANFAKSTILFAKVRPPMRDAMGLVNNEPQQPLIEGGARKQGAHRSLAHKELRSH